MSKAEKVFRNVLRESELSTTLGILGPSGSAKSTTQTLILPKSSNRLLSRNIGDIAQTSLVDTIIGLTSELDDDEVCIQCAPKKYGTDFQDSVLEALWTRMYDQRDELDEFCADEDMIKQILNPENKSFHAYEFVVDNDIETEKLSNTIENIARDIAENPEDINDFVEREFKERKKIDKKPVKKQVFQKVVMERFFANAENLKPLEEWYSYLLDQIESHFGTYWTIPEEHIIYGNVVQNAKIAEFIEDVYESNSAFSLLFKSLRYVVRPNEDFVTIYKQRYGVKEGDKLRLSLNLLDTVGLTQIGDSKEIVENAVEENLGKKVDAFLFLCGMDVKPTVYSYCMDALKAHSKRIENMPFTICRTKVDIVLRNKMTNISRTETGSNVLDNEEKYPSYVEQAFNWFKEEYLTKFDYSENEFGKNEGNENQVVEYVSMAPDMYNKMLEVNSNLNGNKHIIEVVLNLLYAVDRKYIENDVMRVKGKIGVKEPVKIVMKKEYFEGLAASMVLANDRGKNQYLQYRNGCFHGYSITCFFSKHSRGVGHETHCNVYDDFKLHIKNMIRGWITREIIDNGEKSYTFDYEGVLMVDRTEMIPFITKFENRFSQVLNSDIVNIVDRVAKKMSYDFFEDKFWSCYNWKSRQTGFKENLELFYDLFSDEDYWKNNLEKAFFQEYSRIVNRMCDFIVEEANENGK